jgi:hypothetical protein
MIYTINIKDSVNYLKICESYINPEDDNCNEHCNVFWGVALCSLVDTDQLMMETVSSYKMLTSYLPDCKLLYNVNLVSTRLHGATSQMTAVFIFIARESRISVTTAMFGKHLASGSIHDAAKPQNQN